MIRKIAGMKKLFFILFLFTIAFVNFSKAQTFNITQLDTFAISALPDQPILKVVVNTGASSSLSLERLVVYSTSEDSLDIENVRIYRTTGNRFSKADYPAEIEEITSIGANLLKDSAVFTGLTFPLKAGDNIIWVVYDLSKTSKAGHFIDGYIKAGGIKISGNTYPAENANPNGEILIRQKYFTENFEKFGDNRKPLNWTISGDINADWKCELGGYAGNPSTAKSGSLNARSYAENPSGRVSRMISKPLNLSLSIKPKLTFYHAQMFRPVTDKSDSLGIYYGFTSTGPWNFIKNYTLPTPDGLWVKREIDLPDEMINSNVYLVFKSTAQWGFGVCVDSITIYEANVSERKIKSINCDHPTTYFIPQGSSNNPILRYNIGVTGNTGSLTFSSCTVNSLNTSDDDISNVKLFATADSVFIAPSLIGTGTYSGGKVTFNGFTRKLESGDNYFWITYDVKANAIPDNILDAKITPGDLVISDGATYPNAELSPAGSRIIKQSVFFDDFESDKGWIFNGEFERGAPQGKGGVAFGFRDPSVAYSLSNIMGTDLGLAANTGDYNKSARDLATSPLIQARYFKNTLFSFARWLNAENQDSAVIEYQYEGDSKWNILWETPSTIIDGSWSVFSTSTKNVFDRKNFKLRYRLGTTNVLEEYSGWNIDDVFLTGDSIKYDAALMEFLGPFSACGLTSGEQVQVKVKNTGPKTLSNIPIKLSIDGGKNWVTETIPGDLTVENTTTHTFQPVNLSKPAKYKIIVKLAYPGDNYNDNDSVVYDLTSVPTFTPPFSDGFETDTSFWLIGGINPSWVNGKPSGIGFSNAYEGIKCWKTDAYSGYHALYENSYIESPCFNLSDAEIPVVDMYYRYYTQLKKSGARMEYSLDGGTSYQYLPTNEISVFPWNWYNDSIRTFHDKTIGWTYQSLNGTELTWMNGKQVLPSDAANKSLVRFRFHFKADSSLVTPDPGFAFDNFRILNSPYDAGVVSIDDLSSPACQYANSDKLKVTVKNFGLRKIRQNDSIIVAIKVNDNPVVKDTFKLASDLNIAATQQFTMKKSVNFGDPGNYKIKAYIIDPKPGYYGTDNDTATLDITVYTNPITNLPDTISTARADTLTVKAHFDTDYNYEWIFGGSIVSTTYQVDAITTGFGEHSLTAENKISGCITRDTVFIKRLIPDLGVVEISSPTNNCGYKTPMHPVIKIQNFGTDTIRANQLFPVKLQLNKNAVITENVTLNQKLAPDSIIQLTLVSTLDLITPKQDTLKVWTQIPGDDDITNDTTVSVFQIYGYPDIFLGNDTTIKGKLNWDLDAGTGHKTILWSDGQTTTEKYTISWPGKYWVTVTDNNDCASTDTIKVHMVIHDLKMSSLVAPINACTQTATTAVQCRIKNAGTDTIKISETITLFYEFNNGAKQEEILNLSNELRPNDSIIYTFTPNVDMSATGSYKFKVKSMIAGDIQPLNDSILKTVEVFGKPAPDIGTDRIVQAMTYSLYPGKFVSYKWQDNSTDSVWTISKTKYQSNNTYKVTVTDANGCTGEATAAVFLLINDLKISEAIVASTSCSLSDKEIINVKVENFGNAPLMNKLVDVSYTLNGGAEVKENFTFNGAVGTSMVHTFTAPVNMSAQGNYIFKFKIKFAEDVNPLNDTVTHLSKVLGFPVVDFKAPNDTIVTRLPYTLHAGPGYAEYQWQDNSTDSVFTITKDNYVAANPIYTVVVTNSSGCSVTKDVKVIEAFYDLGITGINTPLSNCTLPAGKLRVNIRNNSSVAIINKSVTLGYTLNGGAQVNKTVNVTLSKGATQTVEFDGDVNMSAIATHNLNVSLTFAEDEDAANNTASYEVKVFGNPNYQLSTDTLRTNVIPATLDAGAGFASYKWSNNATNQTISVSSNGWYKVVVTDNNNCTAKDSIYFINTTGTGWLKDHAQISLYPNPAVNYLHIRIGLEKKENLMLDMVSQTGKVVFTKKLENVIENIDEVDVSTLPKGLYYIRLYSKDSMIVEKIMVR